MTIHQRSAKGFRDAKTGLKMRFSENNRGIRAPASIDQLAGSRAGRSAEYPRGGDHAMPSVFHGMADLFEHLRPVAKKLVHEHDDMITPAGKTLHEIEIAGVTSGSQFLVEKNSCDVHVDDASFRTRETMFVAKPLASAMRQRASTFGFVRAFKRAIGYCVLRNRLIFRRPERSPLRQ